MASVEEVYRDLGVVHTDDCAICEVDEPRVIVGKFKGVRKMSWIDRVLIGTLLIGLGVIIGMWIAWQPLPYERIYRDFNHLKMYEDGSYVGEDKEGRQVTGCVVGGLCQD